MITQVKWNTGKPRFEDVEGKIVIVEWGHTAAKEMDSFKFFDVLSFERVNWKNVKSYAILSDEQQACCCCWIRLPDASGIEQYAVPDHQVSMLKPLGNFCPHCGLPIHIVDELKPLPLMGIEPTLVQIDTFWYLTWSKTGEFYQFSGLDKNKIFESWNSFVGKLTSEK